ncbi:hypothetical protein NC653_003349 [Populus alba x Populus x berolinensis]|uniref:Uncharacterized protein n=1 Tax=Populus alba x Populus x berolinensis TaxID=444605 RepID=A0AAD6RSD7_9ROSI|nr:hypothetical protein NC653_003349 [Populus alba x Populus x berolinensis]
MSNKTLLASCLGLFHNGLLQLGSLIIMGLTTIIFHK